MRRKDPGKRQRRFVWTVLEVLLRDARGTVANAKACDRRGVCKRTVTRVRGVSYRLVFGGSSTFWLATFIIFREAEPRERQGTSGGR